MTTSDLPRRSFLTATLGLLALGAAACSGSSTTSSTSASKATATSSGGTLSAGTSTGGTLSGSTLSAGTSTSGSGSAATSGSNATPSLASLTSEVASTFKQFVYTDAQTGKTLPYNLYIPADYDASKAYPVVLYIADSSLVGQAVTAPLSQYGALIWASASEQAKHESFVLVPEYPSVIIDDHGAHTTTEYVEMTTRLLTSVRSKYRIDANRVYGTGQSMGCMTVMYLAAKHPTLFTAELFVSGQWDVTVLQNLAKEKFFYIAAGGDPFASAGQAAVKKMLTADGVAFQSATWDATWSAAQTAAAAAKVLAAGDAVNFASFATGSVLKVAGAGSSSAMGGEHMASFEPAYKITALRDWLFRQRG